MIEIAIVLVLGAIALWLNELDLRDRRRCERERREARIQILERSLGYMPEQIGAVEVEESYATWCGRAGEHIWVAGKDLPVMVSNRAMVMRADSQVLHEDMLRRQRQAREDPA